MIYAHRASSDSGVIALHRPDSFYTSRAVVQHPQHSQHVQQAQQGDQKQPMQHSPCCSRRRAVHWMQHSALCSACASAADLSSGRRARAVGDRADRLRLQAVALAVVCVVQGAVPLRLRLAVRRPEAAAAVAGIVCSNMEVQRAGQRLRQRREEISETGIGADSSAICGGAAQHGLMPAVRVGVSDVVHNGGRRRDAAALPTGRQAVTSAAAVAERAGSSARSWAVQATAPPELETVRTTVGEGERALGELASAMVEAAVASSGSRHSSLSSARPAAAAAAAAAAATAGVTA